MGSVISQLVAQRHPERLSSLTLFGYPRDLDEVTPPDEPGIEPQRQRNTAEAAASDFITPGSISRKAVNAYVALALEADPVRTDIRGLDQYNALDAAAVTVPTLVLQGAFDPIAPTEKQVKLFARLGTAHKQWVVIPGGDHAAHLEAPRAYFIHALTGFLDSVPQK
jgi:pimeloyl-ACP methyl ester carboxylesterase